MITLLGIGAAEIIGAILCLIILFAFTMAAIATVKCNSFIATSEDDLSEDWLDVLDVDD